MNQSLFDIYSIPETEPKSEVVKVKRLNRIVIGDVGSGKTVVAFLTALAICMVYQLLVRYVCWPQPKF